MTDTTNYRPAFKVPNDPKFYTNHLVFKTREEAETYALDKWTKWTGAEEYRVDETTDPVTYTWSHYTLTAITLAKEGATP